MKVQTFSGPTLNDVMQAVRDKLGPDAVILETRTPKGGPVSIRAAIEAPPKRVAAPAKAASTIAMEADLERRLREDLLGVIRTETLRSRKARSEDTSAEPPKTAPRKEDLSLDFDINAVEADEQGWKHTGTMGIVSRKIRRPGRIDPTSDSKKSSAAKNTDILASEEVDKINIALTFHAVPPLLRDELVRAARALDVEDAQSALACAFDARFAIEPIAALPQRPVMLVGPPGAGKTVTAAKLASRAVLLGRGVDIVSTDALRAGAKAQMESFTSILKEDLICVTTPDELQAHLEATLTESPRKPCIIDTPGTNPFCTDELNDLRKFVKTLDIEPVFVAPAGIDAQELADMAQIFSTLGVQRMITTRIDACRRLGGLLAAADNAKLRLAQFSMTPYIARGLATMNPMSLARLFLEHHDAVPAAQTETAARKRA